MSNMSNHENILYYKDFSLDELKEIYIKLKEKNYQYLKKFFNKNIENILNWYEFKEKSSILEIGANLGDITVMLAQNHCFYKIHSVEFCQEKVDIIKERVKTINLKNDKKIEVDLVSKKKLISNNEKYDYITLIGIDKIINRIYENSEVDFKERIKKIFKFVKKHLNNGGKVFIAFDNYLGIRNFSYCNENGQVLLEDKELKKYSIFTKQNIIDISEKEGFFELKTFYPFPDYQNSDVIFSDDCKNIENNIKNYTEKHIKDYYKIFDQHQVMYNIIKSSGKNLPIFSNSIFIELSNKNECIEEKNVKFISFNNSRKEEYRLVTIIDEKSVEKIPLTESSNQHLENIKNNIIYLRNINIKTLDYVKENKVFSKYISNYSTLDQIIAQNWNNENYIKELFNLIRSYLLQSKEEYDEKKSENIIKIIGEENKNLLKELKFIKYGFWDMIPKNCFYIDNELYFFDQEWMVEYLPVEFIIYRGIINCYDYVKKVNVNDIFTSLGILKYIDIFEKLDNHLRSKIIENIELNENEKNVKNISDVINENKFVNNLKREVEMYKRENLKKEKYILTLETQNKILECENIKIKQKLSKPIRYIIKSFFKKGE